MSESEARLEVGIIGMGWIGRQHVETLARRKDVAIAAVCDTDLSRAEEVGGVTGATAFDDWREMLATTSLDAVWVCTPPLAHKEPAVAVLERGVSLYLEKPIARRMRDARAIVAAAEAPGAPPCAVGHQWHALDVLDDLRGHLAGQTVGLMLGQSIGPTVSRPWFLNRTEGGGNLLERGSHHIDLVRLVAGEVGAVQAASGRMKLSGREEGDIDDVVTLLLHLESGALATIVVGWTKDDLPGIYRLDVAASEAMCHLELDPAFRVTGVSRGEPIDATSREHPFSRSQSLFLRAVRRNDPEAVACRPSDAMRTLAVALAAEEALAGGKTVEVPSLSPGEMQEG